MGDDKLYLLNRGEKIEVLGIEKDMKNRIEIWESIVYLVKSFYDWLGYRICVCVYVGVVWLVGWEDWVMWL